MFPELKQGRKAKILKSRGQFYYSEQKSEFALYSDSYFFARARKCASLTLQKFEIGIGFRARLVTFEGNRSFAIPERNGDSTQIEIETLKAKCIKKEQRI